MNQELLMQELDALIAQDHPPAAKIYLRLLQQVWAIDWTVSPYDILCHYADVDVPYFYLFMRRDRGDEAEEDRLLNDWLSLRTSRSNLGGVFEMMDALNELRVKVRRS